MVARPLHVLMVSGAPTWALEEMNKSIRGFFWAAKDRANAGQCLVTWDQVCRPKEVGGLGIKNLRLRSLALRVRWEWLRKTEPSKPWQGLPRIKDTQARDVFDSLVRITVGDVKKVLFWRDRWIRGQSVEAFAPGITLHIDKRVRNTKTVAQAMQDHRWMLDLPGTLALRGARECVALWAAVSNVSIIRDQSDTFSWPWSSSRKYTASSTYKMLMQGNKLFALATAICESKTTPKAKQFMWLAAQHKIWTANRRVRHGLQTIKSSCFVCLQEEDTTEHILIQCVFAREV
jgi:hypothetical protein